MAWIYLLTAGAFEVVWAAGLKKLGLAFSWTLGALTVLALVASMVALYAAMARLPFGHRLSDLDRCRVCRINHCQRDGFQSNTKHIEHSGRDLVGCGDAVDRCGCALRQGL